MNPKEIIPTDRAYCLVPERPGPRPGQVLDISEIKPEEKFIEHSGRDSDKNEGVLISILSAPFQDDQGNYWVEAKYDFPDSRPFKTSLSDCGVVPYNKTGLWNRWNYLARPQENPQS